MTDRDITVTIKLDTGNDDAVGITQGFYVGEKIKRIAYYIMEHQGDVQVNKGGKIRDDNGNTIGEWSLDGDLTWSPSPQTEQA